MAILLAATFIAHVQNFSTARRLTRGGRRDNASNLRPSQFSLMRLVIWTTGIGLFLGLCRLATPNLMSVGEFSWGHATIGATIGLIQSTILVFPLLGAALPLASCLLDERPRSARYLTLKCVALAALITLGEYFVLGAYVFVVSGFSVQNTSDALHDSLVVVAVILGFNLGILIESAVSLAVARWCGFRFTRPPLAAHLAIDPTFGGG